MNVLVLNLTRLGDLLQSQPVIAGLKAKGCRVGLVCLENFAGAAALIDGVDELFPLPGARLLARLASNWRQAVAAQREFAAEALRRLPPDVVVNLTPSEPARLLALQCNARETRGFALDGHGFNADAGCWAAFLQLAAQSRGASPFNVVDLFRRIAGLSGPSGPLLLRRPPKERIEAVRVDLAARFPSMPERGLVALQLGASEERRRWPVGSFAVLARRLVAAGYGPVLVGSESERPLGARCREAAGVPLADCMGETDLPGLAAALCACRLLVTNDTGTMHLAAGLDVPCLAFFLATAQPWDTAPYKPGCFCLEPDVDCHPCAFGTVCPHGERCRRSISPEGAADLALALLEGANATAVRVPGARVWRTEFGRDGLMDLCSVSGHEATDRVRLIRLERALYRRYLDGERLEAGILPEAALGAGAANAIRARLDDAAGLLRLLQGQGELLLRNPLPTAKAGFLDTWRKIETALAGEEHLAVFAFLWRFETERPGLDLPAVLRLAARFSALLAAMRGRILIGTQAA